MVCWVVVTGRNREEHLRNLELVFERLARAGFKLNLNKCKFFEPEIKYLGHFINKDGFHMDGEKIRAMRECPAPQTVTEVRAYVGTVNYYGKFISNLSSLLEPLYKLLRKDTEFRWSETCEQAFLKSKEAISSEVILAHFDPTVQLKLVCDASGVGIGCVLLHVYPDGSEKPISFASRVLNKHEAGYSVIHKEALAIVWGVRKFYQYLLGNHFYLCSDHRPLLALFGETKGIPQMAAGRLQRWALFLSGFNYTFKHIKGSENGTADMLSRLPLPLVNPVSDEVEMDYFHYLVEEHLPVTATDIRKEVRTDVLLSTVYRYVRDGWPHLVSEELKPFLFRSNELTIDTELIMWGYRVIIPPKFRDYLLRELHAVHSGIVRMKAVARQYFWWPGLDNDIERFAKSCDACLSNSVAPPKAKLIKFQDGSHVFDRIHIDYLGPYQGKNYLIITDSFSKWPEVYEVSKTDTSHTVDKLRDCFARFGLPNKIVSDNGPQFISEEFQLFCRENGIEHVTSAPYHPSTNGAAENSVKSLKFALNKMITDKNCKDKLPTLIVKYLFSYRTTPHSVTGQSPANLMFGHKVKTRFDFLTSDKATKAKARQIKYHKGTRVVDLLEGEEVYVRDYRDSPTKCKWTKGIIVKQLGHQTFLCKPLDDTDLLWKRHLDQILKIGTFYESVLSEMLDRDITRIPLESTNYEGSQLTSKPSASSIYIPVRENDTVECDPSVSNENNNVVRFETPVISDTSASANAPPVAADSNNDVLNSSGIKNRLRPSVKPPVRLDL